MIGAREKHFSTQSENVFRASRSDEAPLRGASSHPRQFLGTTSPDRPLLNLHAGVQHPRHPDAAFDCSALDGSAPGLLGQNATCYKSARSANNSLSRVMERLLLARFPGSARHYFDSIHDQRLYSSSCSKSASLFYLITDEAVHSL